MWLCPIGDSQRVPKNYPKLQQDKITSYTCYIYPTTMSGNLKQKRCAYGREFKLKVVQYANNSHNNRQTAH